MGVAPILFGAIPTSATMNFSCPSEAEDVLTNPNSTMGYLAFDMQDGLITVDVYFINNTFDGCSGTATIYVDATDSDGNCAINGPYVINAAFNDNTAPAFVTPANTGNHLINDCPYVPGFDYAAAFVYDDVNGTLTFNGPSGPVDLSSHVPVAFDECVQNGTNQLEYDQLEFVVENVNLGSSNPPCERNIRTYFRATDNCNNSTTLPSQRDPNPGNHLRVVFSIQDTEAPMLDPLPNPTFTTSGGAQCGVGVQGISTGPVAPNTAFTVFGLPFNAPNNTQFDDNCDLDANVTLDLLTIVESSPGDECNNTVTLTWRVTDQCSNLSSQSQVITYENDAAPTITPEANPVSIDCALDDSPNGGNVDNPTAVDYCGNAITNIIFGPVNTNVPGLYYGNTTPTACAQNPMGGNLNGEKTFQRAWTAVDDCGNVSATYFQNITVTDTQAPNMACPGNWNLATSFGADCPGTAVITLNEDQVTPIPQGTPFTVAGQPFNAPSGITDDCGNVDLYVWNIAQTLDPCNSTFEVTWRAVDDCGNYVDCVQSFFVTDNTMPTISDQPGALDETILLTDPNGPCPNDFVGITYNLNTLELWVQFMSGDSIGPYTMPSATDDCSGVTVLPNLSMVPDAHCEMMVTVTYDVFDDCFNYAAAAYTQVLTLVNDAAPEFNPGLDTDDVVLGCPNEATPANFFYDEPNFQLFFNSVNGQQNVQSPQPGDWIDACGMAELELVSVVKDPAPANLCNATFTLTWQLNNGCGESSSVFISRVDVNDNTAPSFPTFPPDVTVTCYPELNFYLNQLVAEDNCMGHMVDVDVMESSNGGMGCVGDPEIITRTYTATDECNNTYSQDQIITIIDDEAPVFTYFPGNAFYSCIGDVPLANPDSAIAQSGANCSDMATVTVMDVFLGGTGCPNDPIDIHREFTATDACGNMTVQTQEITVVDDIVPDASACGDLDDTFECAGPAANEAAADAWNNANIAMLEACATDNCAASVTVTSDYDFNNFSSACGNTGSITVTYTIEDDCGNAITRIGIFTVEDTTAPNWDVLPQDTVVECDGNGNQTDLTTWLNNNAGSEVSDDCGGLTFQFAIQDSIHTGCGTTDTVYYTFYVMDECANINEAVAKFITVDTQAPNLWKTAQNYEAECDMNNQGGSTLQVWLDLHGGAAAEDECNNVTWTYDLIGTNAGCGNTGNYVYEFTATDDCGNDVSTSATFSYVDNTPPTITVQPSNESYNCDANGYTTALNNWLNSNGGMVAQDMCGNVNYSNSLLSSNSGCGNTGTFTYEFTATDECGMSVSASATFTVTDTNGPVLSGVPADVSVPCEQPVPSPASVTADDCDSNPIIVAFNEIITPVNAGGIVSVITRTWTATDDCNNTTTATQTITITDNTPPVILNCPTDIGPLSLNGASCIPVTWDPVDAADNCNVTSFNTDVQPGTCLPAGIHTVTYSASDEGGNTATCQFTISIDANQGYCPVPNTGTQFYIHRLVFNNVSNTSGNNGGYADFTHINASANAGGDLMTTFIPGSSSGFNFPAYWSVFVDFNDDGDFVDAGELIFQRRGNGPFIWRIALPANIPTGPHTMRVYMHRYHFPQPCDNHQGLGEAEDYTLHIQSNSRVVLDDRMVQDQIRDLEVFGIENNVDVETEAATNKSVAEEVNVYPNPAVNWLYIDLANYSTENGEITIFDGKGMVVNRIPFEANGEATLQINVSDLADGLYYARIHNDKTAVTKNFIVNRRRP